MFHDVSGIGFQYITESDLTDLVQGWVDGTESNYGIYLYGGNDGDNFTFRSSEYAIASDRPELTVTFTRPEKPDLIVSDLYPDPAPSADRFYVGQSINCYVTVRNNSGGPAGSSRVGYYLGTSSTDLSNPIFHYSTSVLNVGDSDTDVDSYVFTESDIGERFLICWADHDEDVDESIENNNTRPYGPFNVAAAPVSYTLTTSVVGGNGSLSSGGTYESGEVVTLIATPSAGYKIKEWSGTNNDSSTATTNTVTMTSDKSVTVEFELVTYTLATSVIGGNGTISTGGTYNSGEVVPLTATPDTGYRVKSWAGTDNDSSTATTNAVTMDSSKTVTVEFELITYSLTISVSGDGRGTITATATYESDRSISFTHNSGVSEVTAPYNIGEVVILTVTPDAGYRIKPWSGTDDDSSTATTNTVTMTSNRTVTVEFEPIPLAVAFATTSSSGSEAVSPAILTVNLSVVTTKTVTVNYSATGGTATGGGVDYSLAPGTLIFVAGDTTEDIPITIVNDSSEEANETIIVTLSNPENAPLGTNTNHTYTIIDDDGTPAGI